MKTPEVFYGEVGYQFDCTDLAVFQPVKFWDGHKFKEVNAPGEEYFHTAPLEDTEVDFLLQNNENKYTYIVWKTPSPEPTRGKYAIFVSKESLQALGIHFKATKDFFKFKNKFIKPENISTKPQHFPFQDESLVSECLTISIAQPTEMFKKVYAIHIPMMISHLEAAQHKSVETTIIGNLKYRYKNEMNLHFLKEMLTGSFPKNETECSQKDLIPTIINCMNQMYYTYEKIIVSPETNSLLMRQASCSDPKNLYGLKIIVNKHMPKNKILILPGKRSLGVCYFKQTPTIIYRDNGPFFKQFTVSSMFAFNQYRSLKGQPPTNVIKYS